MNQRQKLLSLKDDGDMEDQWSGDFNEEDENTSFIEENSDNEEETSPEVSPSKQEKAASGND